MKAERAQELAKKQTERESLRRLPDAFKLNLSANPDRFYEIILGQYRPPKIDGEDDRITKSVDTDSWHDATNKRKAPVITDDVDGDADDDGVQMVEPIKRTVSQSVKTNKYAKITERLDRFPFSDDPVKKAQQISTVEKCIRNGMNTVILQEVVANTKKIFGKYVVQSVKAPGGLTVRFRFADKTFDVTAAGNFFGDETVAVFANDKGGLSAAVMKFTENGQEIFEDFKVTMGEI